MLKMKTPSGAFFDWKRKTPFWRLFVAVNVRFLLLGILALKNCLHEESEKKNMKVRHHD